MPLTQAQTNTLATTERVVSVFSILGIFFILFTFYCLKSFHKPINRLIFFASFGNLGMNIACLIAEDGIAAGSTSGLCTFQAFLIQMFLGVDAFWACCMALNVYLAFFHKYTARQLRDLDKWYLLGCYGASFVPALTLAFVDTARRGRVYGPAILWCWIDLKWDFLRIALLYGIVWVAIVFAFIIYVKAFRVIYSRRDQLRGFLNPLNEHPFMTGTITTSIDIRVDRVTSPSDTSNANNNNNIFDKDFDSSQRTAGKNNENHQELDEFHPYVVNVEAPERMPSGVREVTREVARKETTNPGAWLYARVAFLFFLSMVIIWLPSSANRVYALVHPSRINYPLNYASALVLPAQGFLNVIVYMVTSQTATRQFFSALRRRQRMPWRDDLLAFPWARGMKSKAGLDLEMAGLEGRAPGGGGGGGGGKGGKKVWEKRSLGSLGGSEVSVPIMARTREIG
ncbi:MAG: hypothetical protein Q9219_004673 [cf. Caloplaca sp. 3 TL-2023]